MRMPLICDGIAVVRDMRVIVLAYAPYPYAAAH